MNTNKIFARFFNWFRRYPVRKNMITLIEKLETGGTGSLYELKNELERRGLKFEYNIITHEDYAVRLSNIPGLFRLFFHKAKCMACSSFIFLNDNFMPMAYMDISDETTVVQMWHGMGSFKKFGGSSEKDPKVIEELRQANLRVTHILASSENIIDNYAQAFLVPRQKVLCIGAPQMDYYFREHDLTGDREELFEKYPAMKGKKLALYAPTFRGDDRRDQELLEAFDFERFEKELGTEYCLAVRLHPQIRSSSVPEYIPDLTDYPDVRKLLCLTDLLITDYSSITVEYSQLQKPLILYAFDKEWYLDKDRSFYFDYEKTAPGPIVENMEDLIRTIQQKDWDPEKTVAFARLHNSFFDDQSARRVADYYFGNENEHEERIGTMKIIAGLGNPTDEYKNTRHNVGFMAADELAERMGVTINQHKFKALCASGFLGGQRVLLMKPITYMNRSGEAIRAVMDFYKVDPEDLLVIYDDISIEPGMVRIRPKGSAGGHNGMKSIISHLGSDAFPRIRVGIGGQKHPGQDLADYVLSRFSKEETEKITDAVERAASAAELFAADNLSEAMNRYSTGKKKRAKEQAEQES